MKVDGARNIVATWIIEAFFPLRFIRGVRRWQVVVVAVAALSMFLRVGVSTLVVRDPGVARRACLAEEQIRLCLSRYPDTSLEEIALVLGRDIADTDGQETKIHLDAGWMPGARLDGRPPPAAGAAVLASLGADRWLVATLDEETGHLRTDDGALVDIPLDERVLIGVSREELATLPIEGSGVRRRVIQWLGTFLPLGLAFGACVLLALWRRACLAAVQRRRRHAMRTDPVVLRVAIDLLGLVPHAGSSLAAWISAPQTRIGNRLTAWGFGLLLLAGAGVLGVGWWARGSTATGAWAEMASWAVGAAWMPVANLPFALVLIDAILSSAGHRNIDLADVLPRESTPGEGKATQGPGATDSRPMNAAGPPAEGEKTPAPPSADGQFTDEALDQSPQSPPETTGSARLADTTPSPFGYDNSIVMTPAHIALLRDFSRNNDSLAVLSNWGLRPPLKEVDTANLLEGVKNRFDSTLPDGGFTGLDIARWSEIGGWLPDGWAIEGRTAVQGHFRNFKVLYLLRVLVQTRAVAVVDDHVHLTEQGWSLIAFPDRAYVTDLPVSVRVQLADIDEKIAKGLAADAVRDAGTLIERELKRHLGRYLGADRLQHTIARLRSTKADKAPNDLLKAIQDWLKLDLKPPNRETETHQDTKSATEMANTQVRDNPVEEAMVEGLPLGAAGNELQAERAPQPTPTGTEDGPTSAPKSQKGSSNQHGHVDGKVKARIKELREFIRGEFKSAFTSLFQGSPTAGFTPEIAEEWARAIANFEKHIHPGYAFEEAIAFGDVHVIHKRIKMPKPTPASQKKPDPGVAEILKRRNGIVTGKSAEARSLWLEVAAMEIANVVNKQSLHPLSNLLVKIEPIVFSLENSHVTKWRHADKATIQSQFSTITELRNRLSHDQSGGSKAVTDVITPITIWEAWEAATITRVLLSSLNRHFDRSNVT